MSYDFLLKALANLKSSLFFFNFQYKIHKKLSRNRVPNAFFDEKRLYFVI